MKTLEIDYSMSLEFSVPVINHYFVLRCMPVSRGCQTVVARNLEVTPEVTLQMSKDVFGNVAYRGLISEPHTSFSFKATAKVHVNVENGSREPCIPLYKYPTGLTNCTDSMKSFLIEIFKNTELEESVRKCSVSRKQVLSFADRLSKAVHSYLEYKPGVTTVKTSARDAFEMKQGVCQDYAHLFCSLSRAAGVPARYVCGTTKGEGTTHAWAEVFVPDLGAQWRKSVELNGRWYGFDPTRNKKCDDDYVILAVGRDYNDCQVDRGIFRGNADQTQTVFVKTMNEQ